MYALVLQGNLRFYGVTNIDRGEAQTVINIYGPLNKPAATEMIIMYFLMKLLNPSSKIS